MVDEKKVKGEVAGMTEGARRAGGGRVGPFGPNQPLSVRRKGEAALGLLRFCSAAFFGLFIILGADQCLAKTDLRDSMVKIYSVSSYPDYDEPWKLSSSTIQGTGSGCVIAGQKILTSAHVVSNHTFIQVRRYGQRKKYTAKLIAASHEADLALLTVEDPSFFKGVQPLRFGDLPQIQQKVITYGFPVGGDNLSISAGNVSRIEHNNYVHSNIGLLTLQGDTAINPGNSGGPVIVDGLISGVAMQVNKRLKGIGYMVPVPVIRQFMKDLEDGQYHGIPTDGLICQNMENKALKDMYGLEGSRGVLVTEVIPGSPAEGRIFPGDVVLSVDGFPIFDDGTSEFRPREYTSADYYIQLHQIGGTLKFEILRDRSRKTVKLVLDKPVGSLDLVPRSRYDVKPTFFIYGGLVFQPLTLDYLKTWGRGRAPSFLLDLYYNGRRSVKGEEVVLLSKVLQAEVNIGYHDWANLRITKVNGRKINNLKELIRAIESKPQKDLIVFTAHDASKIVLDRRLVEASRKDILNKYNIPKDRSDDSK